jgi:hypothetical protein
MIPVFIIASLANGWMKNVFLATVSNINVPMNTWILLLT